MLLKRAETGLRYMILSSCWSRQYKGRLKMALKRKAYRELEDILGAENISEEPAVLDGYAFYFRRGPGAENQYFTRPEAIVLPGSTEDVQAIMRLCNRHGLKSKATSTSYGPWSAVGGEGVIIIDLRRMNRILEIDEKNMYIVVEPYVSFAQVQAEAQKRGLNCNVITAGPSASFLANYTSMHGHNIQAISQGYSGRNLLGVEWVLPTGEVLKLGSLGSGAGWFSGDGPGPSLRGIMRGIGGLGGGLGVFTKCAGHLHPWPGPPTMEIEGVSPYYEAEIPPLFEYHIMEWPNWEQCADAQYKIGEAGIAYILHKAGGPGTHGSIVTGNNNELYEKRQSGEFTIPEFSLAIVMAGNTPEEHAYQQKVLDRILADTGGKIVPTGEDPTFRKRDYIHLIKTSFSARLAFRLTGSMGPNCLMLAGDTIDNAAVALNMADRFVDKYKAKGVLYDDGGYNNWATAIENGHWGHYEGPLAIDATDEKSFKGAVEADEEARKSVFKVPLSNSWDALGWESTKKISPHCGNFHTWMRKIKKAFDPNTASDPSGYVSAEEE
jgi:glycolate oxidase